MKIHSHLKAEKTVVQKVVLLQLKVEKKGAAKELQLYLKAEKTFVQTVVLL
jgi:hypothetical protein